MTPSPIYLDFSKAFDKVDHQILMKKVESLGIGGKLKAWLTAFLTNRQQQVKVNGALSPKEWVKSGVPQGSVLGPLLFLIMMYDINKDVLHSMVGSYADDTRLWKMIRGRQDQQKLQSDLKAMYRWADNNNMGYNGEKIEYLGFGPGEDEIEEERQYTDPTGEVIEKKDCVKNLGVLFDEKCAFDAHVTTLSSHHLKCRHGYRGPS